MKNHLHTDKWTRRRATAHWSVHKGTTHPFVTDKAIVSDLPTSSMPSPAPPPTHHQCPDHVSPTTRPRPTDNPPKRRQRPDHAPPTSHPRSVRAATTPHLQPDHVPSAPRPRPTHNPTTPRPLPDHAPPTSRPRPANDPADASKTPQRRPTHVPPAPRQRPRPRRAHFRSLPGRHCPYACGCEPHKQTNRMCNLSRERQSIHIARKQCFISPVPVPVRKTEK